MCLIYSQSTAMKACCGTFEYDVTTHICCNARLSQRLNDSTECCGENIFMSDSQLCCNDTVYSKLTGKVADII